MQSALSHNEYSSPGTFGRYFVWALIASPIVALVSFVAWIVVPVVVGNVVPAVVQAVTTSN